MGHIRRLAETNDYAANETLDMVTWVKWTASGEPATLDAVARGGGGQVKV